MNHGLIPYIGGKHRMAGRLSEIILAQGRDCFVDVFGGSAAVLIKVVQDGMVKRVYNDLDEDLANLFRVVADPESRRLLLRKLRWTPPSRGIFVADYAIYKAAGFSFAGVADPVERARMTFYRQSFAYGGKGRSGGFVVSPNECHQIKEVKKYRNALRRMAAVGELFRDTVIEQLNYLDVVERYGGKKGVVLYCDPPYFGTERYYSTRFTEQDHGMLALQLNAAPCPAVVSYSEWPGLADLYPEDRWEWRRMRATKNSLSTAPTKERSEELVLIKRMEAA